MVCKTRNLVKQIMPLSTPTGHVRSLSRPMQASLMIIEYTEMTGSKGREDHNKCEQGKMDYETELPH